MGNTNEPMLMETMSTYGTQFVFGQFLHNLQNTNFLFRLIIEIVYQRTVVADGR